MIALGIFDKVGDNSCFSVALLTGFGPCAYFLLTKQTFCDRSPNFDGRRESLCGVVVNILDCNFVVSKFKLQSRYYIHFRTKTVGNGMNLLIFPQLWVTYFHNCFFFYNDALASTKINQIINTTSRTQGRIINQQLKSKALKMKSFTDYFEGNKSHYVFNKEVNAYSKIALFRYTSHLYTHIYIYIYICVCIYIYMCVCVCVL